MADKQPIQADKWAGSDYGPYEKFPSEGRKLRDFWLMRRYDPTVRAVLNRLELTISARPATFTMGEKGGAEGEPAGPVAKLRRRLQRQRADQPDNSPEAKLANWVNGELHRLLFGKTNFYRGLLSAVGMGFVLAQKRWDTSNPQAWLLDSVMPLHPLTFCGMSGAGKDAIEINADGSLASVRQWDANGLEHELDVEQLIYWPVSSVYAEDKYGVSWLEAARRPWYIATALERFWSVWCESGAYPNIVAEVQSGRVTDLSGNETAKTKAEYFAEAFANMTPGNALVFEGAMDPANPAIRIINLLLNEHAGSAFLEAISYWESEKYKALSYPVLLLQDPKHSSRAQVQTVLEDWLRCLDGLERELGEVIREQVIAPMVLYNFGEQAAEDALGLGGYHFPPLEQDDLAALASTLDTILRERYIRVTEADEDKWRNIFAPILASAEEAEASRELAPPATPAGPTAPVALDAQDEVRQRYAHLDA